ncbi:hypothetical protein HDU99_003021, partial [Rhizoclosmatium hyalinum]
NLTGNLTMLCAKDAPQPPSPQPPQTPQPPNKWIAAAVYKRVFQVAAAKVEEKPSYIRDMFMSEIEPALRAALMPVLSDAEHEISHFKAAIDRASNLKNTEHKLSLAAAQTRALEFTAKKTAWYEERAFLKEQVKTAEAATLALETDIQAANNTIKELNDTIKTLSPWQRNLQQVYDLIGKLQNTPPKPFRPETVSNVCRIKGCHRINQKMDSKQALRSHQKDYHCDSFKVRFLGSHASEGNLLS